MRFRLHGLCVAAHSSDAHLQTLLADALVFKSAEREPRDDARPDLSLAIDVDAAVPEAPAGVHEIGTDERGLGVSFSDDVYYVTHASVYLRVEPSAGRATGTVRAPRDAYERAQLYQAVSVALMLLLRARGLHALHAAALAHGDVAALFVAESDSGKSTTALNLVRQGWDFVSDDTVLLRAGAQVEALCFRRDFCVDPDATELFPELDERVWPPSPSNPDKWRVDIGALYPGRLRAAMMPTLLVLPRIVDRAESRLVPIAPTEALMHLMLQGVLFLTPQARWAQPLMAALGALTQQAATYRLEAGRDALERPERVAALLTAAAAVPDRSP